jgi:hypothetical protein
MIMNMTVSPDKNQDSCQEPTLKMGGALFFITAEIAQSVQQQAKRWMARVRFLAGARDFSLLHSVQTGSGGPTIQWVLGGSSQGMKLTTHLHLVPRSRTVELYFHSPLIKHADNFTVLPLIGVSLTIV